MAVYFDDGTVLAGQTYQKPGGLYLAGVPGGGFDVDPFEANTALAVTGYAATVGAGRTVDVPVVLTLTEAGGA